MKRTQRLICEIALLAIVALTLRTGQVAEASGPLPPYPTPVPPSPAAPPSPRTSAATIELQAPAAGGLWAGVQWQAQDGAWHDVAGWQGPVDVTGVQRWWVEPKDFGTGPFRWVVNTPSNPIAWGVSAPFSLPRAAGDVQSVSVSAATPLPSATAPSTTSGWRFALTPELAYQGNAAACGQYTIAGQVFNRAGQPLNSYRLRLTYPNGDQETILSGSAPDYGTSGFGFLLGRRKPNRVYTLELLAPDAQTKLAAPESIVFLGDCGQNVAWAVFREIEP